MLFLENSSAKDMLPDVAPRMGGILGTWRVVWTRDYTPTDGDVYGAEVYWAGSSSTAFAVVASGDDDRNPCVSTQDLNDVHLVVWERANGLQKDLYGAAMANQSVMSVRDLTSADGGVPGVSQTGPDVAVDAGRYVVVYAEPPSFSVVYSDIRASTFHIEGGLIRLDEGHVALCTTDLDDTAPRVACERSDQPILVLAMAVWQASHASGVKDVYGARYAVPIIGFVSFCAGDGQGPPPSTPCPCGNWGTAGNGCANSVNPSGANLTAFGEPVYDTVVLEASGMPATASCIYLQGDGLDDLVFGDGVRCVGGTLLRLRTRANVAGASSFPDSTDTVTLATRGGVTPGSGDTRSYQTYYRNAAASFCPPATFNVTNGWQIVW